MQLLSRKKEAESGGVRLAGPGARGRLSDQPSGGGGGWVQTPSRPRVREFGELGSPLSGLHSLKVGESLTDTETRRPRLPRGEDSVQGAGAAAGVPSPRREPFHTPRDKPGAAGI